MVTPITLTAQPRDTKLKVNALRRIKMVPGVVYGRKTAARSLQFEYLPLARVVRQAGTSHLVALKIAGETETANVLIREVQHDAITSRILHVDLFAFVAGEKIRASIPLLLHGKSPAESLGGLVLQSIDEIEVECAPEHLPESIPVDLDKLETLHSRLTVADLVVPAEVTVLVPADTEVVHVGLQRMKAEVEEVKPAEAAEGAAAAAGAAEGEAKPAAQEK